MSALRRAPLAARVLTLVTVLQNIKVDSIARGGSGPLTPPLQWLWKQPLLKIFCNYSHPSRFVVRFCPPGWG